MRSTTLCLLVLAAGCVENDPTAAESVSSIRVVAVLPFADQTGRAGFDPDEAGNLLASQLTKLGFRVVRPQELRAAAPPGGVVRTASEAVGLARKMHADAVLACAVTEFDPYDPPRVAVRTQFLKVAPGTVSDGDIDRLLRSPSWDRGPLSLSREGAPHALAAFEEVYDARDRRVRSELEDYSREYGSGDTGFPGAREFLAVQSKYFEFVSYRILHRIFEGEDGRGS